LDEGDESLLEAVLLTDWVLTCDACCETACDIASFSDGIGRKDISIDAKGCLTVSTQLAIACRFPGWRMSEKEGHLRFVGMELLAQRFHEKLARLVIPGGSTTSHD